MFIVLTLFPQIIEAYVRESILARAIRKGLIKVVSKNIRDFALDSHKTVDDRPYGGGAGMVLKVDVVEKAISWARSQALESLVILLGPRGVRLTQREALEFANFLERKEEVLEKERRVKENAKKALILLSGHYEGVDERVRYFVDREISLGDFILTGGELPALAIIDATSRLIPGVLDKESSKEESFTLRDPETGEELLEYPQYTRPREYKGLKVPEILFSGDHQKISAWRLDQARKITRKLRSQK